MYNKKRGQITLIIIIGIVLLLGIALVLFIQKNSFTIEKENIPEEIVPLYSFVEGCMEEVSKKDLELIGRNGGYLSIPEHIKLDPFAHIAISPPNYITPYWWYESNNRAPTNTFIKNQLESSMNEKLKKCINGFKSFKDIQVEELSDISTEVTLADENILFDVQWNLKISNQAIKNKIDRFTISQDIRLSRILELARAIMNTENKEFWFEDFTFDLISLDPEIPTTNFEIKCSPKIWFMKNVENKLKKLLQANVPLIKVRGTNHRSTPKDQQYVKNHYSFTTGEKTFPRMHATFTFDPRWNFEFYARPNNGLFLTSGQMQGQDIANVIDMSWFCMQNYHFTYDVQYPIMVSLRDEETSKNKEYSFNFAFPVILNHNIPDKETLPQSFEFEYSPLSKEYCADNITKEFTIRTVNNVTKEDIPDINVSFACLKFKCGIIGSSDYMEGGIAGLNTDLPLCYSGLLTGEGKGYKKSKKIIDTSNIKQTPAIKLTPIKEIKNYTIVKHFIENIQQGSDFESILDENEQAVIFIENSEHTTFGFFPSEEELLPITLLADKDADYTIKIYIMNDDSIVGGYIGPLNIKDNDLKESNSITFHVVSSVETLSEDDQLELFNKLNEYSSLIPKPEIK